MKAVIIFIAVLFSLHFANPALAVSVTITNFPSIITQDQFTITASVSGAATGTNYLRVDLYKEGTTNNYFGETYNGSDWYSGSDGLQYLPVSIVSGSIASATIQGRVGNPNSSDFTGNGIYKLRMRRYTSSGGSGSSDTMSSVDVSITLVPTPTPTPTNTPTPTPTNTPTPTPTPTSSPTNTPTPTPMKTPTPTSESDTMAPSAPENTTQGSVLGETANNKFDISSPGNNLISNQTKKPDTIFQWTIMLLGIVLVVICIIFTIRTIKKGESGQDEKE